MRRGASACEQCHKSRVACSLVPKSAKPSRADVPDDGNECRPKKAKNKKPAASVGGTTVKGPEPPVVPALKMESPPAELDVALAASIDRLADSITASVQDAIKTAKDIFSQYVRVQGTQSNLSPKDGRT